MVAITAYIRDKDDDSSEDEQLKLSTRSIASKSFTELLPTSQPISKRSTEDMSPKQKSTQATCEIKQARGG